MLKQKRLGAFLSHPPTPKVGERWRVEDRQGCQGLNKKEGKKVKKGCQGGGIEAKRDWGNYFFLVGGGREGGKRQGCQSLQKRGGTELPGGGQRGKLQCTRQDCVQCTVLLVCTCSTQLVLQLLLFFFFLS